MRSATHRSLADATSEAMLHVFPSEAEDTSAHASRMMPAGGPTMGTAPIPLDHSCLRPTCESVFVSTAWRLLCAALSALSSRVHSTTGAAKYGVRLTCSRTSGGHCCAGAPKSWPRTLSCPQHRCHRRASHKRIYDSYPLKIYGFGVAAGVAAGVAG